MIVLRAHFDACYRAACTFPATAESSFRRLLQSSMHLPATAVATLPHTQSLAAAQSIAPTMSEHHTDCFRAPRCLQRSTAIAILKGTPLAM